VTSKQQRRRATIALLLMICVAAATVEVGGYLHGRPTCQAIQSGAEPLTSDRKCFDGSSARKSLVEALCAAAALWAAAGAFLSWRFLARGGDDRRAAIVVSLALILGGLALAVGSF
jgi:hypothetical protein